MNRIIIPALMGIGFNLLENEMKEAQLTSPKIKNNYDFIQAVKEDLLREIEEEALADFFKAKAMGDPRSELSKARGRITELEKELCDLRLENDKVEYKFKKLLAIDWIQILENWDSVTEDYKSLARKLLDGLVPKEQKIIKMLYGIDLDRKYMMPEIAKDDCCTRERIRQIRVRALRHIKHAKNRLYFNAAQTLMLREKLNFITAKND